MFELGPGRTASTNLKAVVAMWRGADKSQPGDVSPPCHPDRRFCRHKVVPPSDGLSLFSRRLNGAYVRERSRHPDVHQMPIRLDVWLL